MRTLEQIQKDRKLNRKMAFLCFIALLLLTTLFYGQSKSCITLNNGISMYSVSMLENTASDSLDVYIEVTSSQPEDVYFESYIILSSGETIKLQYKDHDLLNSTVYYYANKELLSRHPIAAIKVVSNETEVYFDKITYGRCFIDFIASKKK